jgi:hypothetical protein
MVLEIPIFDGGLITNADAEDIPKNACIDTNNFDIDVQGKLIKRKGTTTSSTLSGVNLKYIYKWVNSKLPSPSSYWIAYDTLANRLVRYDSDWTNQTVIKTFSSSQPIYVEIVPFSNRLRFGFDDKQDPSIYEYIDREYFFGLYDPSASFNYDTAKPKQITLTTFENYTKQANGNCPVGYYYYKIVPVYDGMQEPALPDTYAKYYNTSASGVIMMKAEFTTTDFDKRITALNVYRSFSSDDQTAPVYYLQKTIPTNTKSTHIDNKGATNSSSTTGKKQIICMGGDSDTDFSDINTWATTSGFGNSNFDRVYITIGSTAYDWTDDASEGGNKFTYTSSSVLTLNSSASEPDNKFDDDVTITRADATNNQNASETRRVYCGDRLLHNASWDWEQNEVSGYHALISFSSNNDRFVVASNGPLVQVSSGISVSGTSGTVTLTNGYKWSVSGSTVTLIYDDNNQAVSRLHNLTTDKNDIRYRHGKYINGRYYQANVVLDPSDENEVHNDFIMFSEIQQPDVTPITNYIQLKDSQGGEILGLRQVGDSLVVFMENGVYRLRVPSTDPRSFSLKEAEENIGCVSSRSIVQVGSYVFFASKDDIYALTPSYEIQPCGSSIRDIWQGKANKESTFGIYDPIKHRVLYVFGNDTEDVYAIDTEKFMYGGKEVWNHYEFPHTDHKIEDFGIDENLQLYLFHNAHDN